MSEALVDLVVEEEAWLDRLPDLPDAALSGARLALDAVGLDPADYEIAVLACDDDRIAVLNADHRSMARPTNVLSWPAFDLVPSSPGSRPRALPEPGPGTVLPLGDVAIALQTCVHEAENAAIPLKTHVIHLILHSVLHLLGYDHKTEADAELMEGIESTAMIGAGLPDPYATEMRDPRV